MKRAEIAVPVIFSAFDLRDQTECEQQDIVPRGALDELLAEPLSGGVGKLRVQGRARI